MSLQTALRQSRWVTYAVLVAIAWVLLTAYQVLHTMQPLYQVQLPGQTAATGVVGALVMAALLGLLVVLVGELGATSPTPNAWPPEE